MPLERRYLRPNKGRNGMAQDFSKLKRDRNPMPDDVKQALNDHGVMADSNVRPPYQQNDYLSWIGRAKTLKTKEKRLQQMIDELKVGGVYMKMKHPASVIAGTR